MMMFSAKSEERVAVPSLLADGFHIADFMFLIIACKAGETKQLSYIYRRNQLGTMCSL